MEALNRKNQELAHHDRLQTIGTLTSSIAHEFNNLLTPIMGYSILVLEQLPSDAEELYDNVLEIYNSSRKAKEIIARLSDLSRKNTSLTFQYVSPDELVRKVLAVASPARPPHVEVRTDLACRHLWLRGNEIQLSQMLLNLILNAYHAMEPGGGTLTVATRPEGEFLCFQVSDTGSGISPEVLPHIFEPFFTTKERGKGTGLGLAIVRQVMEEHKGTIAIDTAPGRGTTMLLRFPTITPPEEDT
jgi:signal transduction histidine kinase